VSHELPGRATKPFFSAGTIVLMALMAVGFAFGGARFLVGMGPVTNLTNQYPWGIWIAIDVACGVALAAGGFTSAALIEIFGKKQFHALLRPAILTAWLGYALVGFALLFDLGRYWNIWRIIFNWQGNSVLFEVGMCVMAYLFVLTVEMTPALVEGLKLRIENDEWGASLLRPLERPLAVVLAAVKVVLPLFIVAGVVLSCMHQSSLGTLMVIAPTKLNSFWYTPLMPLQFLTSAIMVGYPMVIFESMVVSKSLNRPIEMHLLSPLARYVPWFIAIYATLRLGDLVLRADHLDWVARPTATIAFVVEIFIGIVLPFFALLSRRVRENAGLLFTVALCIILGVVLNRINVFLVGFTPPYATRGYFPAIGEIAVTVAIICLIMFLYRLVVTFFPVLVAHESAKRPASDAIPRVSPVVEWALRSAAAGLLVLFVVGYAIVHKQSIAQARTALDDVYTVKRVVPPPREAPVITHAGRPQGYQTFYFMDNPGLNAVTNDYEPVRFSHRSHDNAYRGNCAVCHHRYTKDKNDRVGVDLTALHREMDIRLGPACTSCHTDMDQNRPGRCVQCHRDANEADAPARLGLKGAYHQQCIGCHEKLGQDARAPVDCIGCHRRNTPDHRSLVSVNETVSGPEVTSQCLGCHPQSGRDVLQSAHFLWHGHSPHVVKHEHETRLGMATVLNNYGISGVSGARECTTCHAGYGLTKPPFDGADPTRIDCLVCHDTTGTYRKDPDSGGMPDASVNLAVVAGAVGRPNRSSCGSCHLWSDGGPNVKHGGLEPLLVQPPADADVHMGRADMRCQDCHTTSRHQIAGSSVSAPAAEGRVTCEQCHGNEPHRIAGLLGRHLDSHVATVACVTCHVPLVARQSPTQVWLDYSTAGLDDPSSLKPAEGFAEGLHMGVLPSQQTVPRLTELPDESQVNVMLTTYDKRYGLMRWQRNLVPTYGWWDRSSNAYVVGDKIGSPPVVLNAPAGDKADPGSRIYPFKIHGAKQPYDKEQQILATPKLANNYWKDYDWSRAISAGMAEAGLKYSGQYDFVETRMYTALQHQVVPAKRALGCADCHQAENVACARCHRKAGEMKAAALTRRVYPQVEHFLDFKALGYEDDPALIGGRFYLSLGRGTPPQ